MAVNLPSPRSALAGWVPVRLSLYPKQLAKPFLLDLLERLAELARNCWDRFNLSGYARVDFRVDGSGNPWVLEVNANPCLSPDAGFAAALNRANIRMTEAMKRILEDT